MTTINGHRQELSVKTHSINEIVNSDTYRAVRREMLEGKVPAACEGCARVEKTGGWSKRLKDSKFRLDFAGLTTPDGSITPDLQTIELRLGNFCNLKCRSCNAESSTSWIKDYYALKDQVPLASGYDGVKDGTGVANYDWVDDAGFYDRLISAAPKLRYLYINGGEPFLVPKHFYLLNKLVAEGRTDVNVRYHTNLNYDLDRLGASLDILKQFDKVTISFSIDDVRERNTFIRAGSDWDLTVKNARLFLERYDFDFYITQTISAYNFLHVEELEHFVRDAGLTLPIFLNHVHAPDYLNATVLPQAIRRAKIDSVEGRMDPRNFVDLRGRYYDAEDNGQLPTFQKFTDAVDKVRGESFSKTFPELRAAL